MACASVCMQFKYVKSRMHHNYCTSALLSLVGRTNSEDTGSVGRYIMCTSIYMPMAGML